MFAVKQMASTPDAGDDFWYQAFPGGRTASGMKVSPETALRLTAVYACVKVISEAVMQLPLILYRRLDNGGKERATDHPLYGLLKNQPNADTTAAEWREVMQHHLLLRGNAYAPLIRDHRRDVHEIGVPYHPDIVTIEELPAGRYRYIVRPDSGGSFAVNPDDMLHARALVVHGRLGLNPIAIERESLGVGLAAQNFAARFFANDAQPGGWIQHPSHFKDDEGRKAFKRAWQASQSGGNHGKTAVLEYGMEYHTISMRLRDAEFLATRKYQNIDICRIFRVPPHLIMELDRATFSNISSQGIEFVKFTLVPWLKRWEQKLNMMLLPVDSDLSFEFLVDGLERGDPDMRSTFYNRGVQDGWLTRNEVRARENLDPLDGLDAPLQPLNMAPAGTGQPNGMRENAAGNLVRSWGHQLKAREPSEYGGFLLAQADRVQSFLACSQGDAEWYCERAVADLIDSEDMGMWQTRQVERLTAGRY
jgi:HK97 family phage portal protein